jgi:YcxB-like protein
MELRYTLTNDDAAHMQRASSRPLWALLLFALLLAAMFSVGIYLIIHDVGEVGWVWLAASAGLGIVVYVAPPIQTRRALRRSQVLQGEIVLLVDPDGVESTFATGKSRLHWKAFTGYKETTDAFVLHTSSRWSTFIPKRLMSLEQTEELRSLLRARIPPKATTNRTA